MTFKLIFIHFILLFCSAIFLFQGCITINDESERKRFEVSKKSHQEIVRQKFDRADNKENSNETTINKSRNTLVEGEVEPEWTTFLPVECGGKYYCGLASNGTIENNKCPDKHVCRDINETSSRVALSKDIETRVRDETRLYLYRQRNNENKSFFSEFKKDVFEQGANKILKNLIFRHFYLTPQRKLFTLAMMEIPIKDDTSEDSQENIDPNTLPPLILALRLEHETDDINEEEITGIVQLRLTEILSNNSFKIADNESIKLFRNTKISDTLDQLEKTLAKRPNSIVFVTSLKGEISANSSRLYPGLTRIFLSFSAYRGEGKLIWKKTYVVKRPGIKKPATLNASEREENYRKTLVKGFKEIDKKGVMEEFKKVF